MSMVVVGMVAFLNFFVFVIGECFIVNLLLYSFLRIVYSEARLPEGAA